MVTLDLLINRVILQEQTRGVIEITSSNSVDTNNYNEPGVFEDTREFRPVVWTKQIEDKIVEGKIST